MSDHDQSVAANLLDRRFTAERQSGVGRRHDAARDRQERQAQSSRDPDSYSRFVMGWAVSTSDDRDLARCALHGALRRTRADSVRSERD
jgi:transposase InsO family protein